MGGGIVMALASAGIAVTIVDISDDVLAAGIARISAQYRSSVDKGAMAESAMVAALARIRTVTDYAALAACDMAIGAALEGLAVKKTSIARYKGKLKQ